MFRYLVVLLLYFLIIKCGWTLKCYSTDFNNETKNIINLRHTLKYCNESINEIRRISKSSVAEIPDDLWPTLRCYTAVIAADGVKDIVLKGCFPEGGCKILDKSFRNVVKNTDSTTVDCRECQENECNLAVKFSDPNSSALSKRTLGVIFYLTVVPLIIFKFY